MKYISNFPLNNKSLKILNILVLACIIYVSGIAQFTPTRVEKSNQVILYQGNNYYIHTVKKGHTLYSICKAYNTTIEQLTQANPGIDFSTLSIGQAIKIPTLNQHVPEHTSQTSSATDKFIQHIVKPKETPYAIAKQYDVHVEDIYKHNPTSKRGIRIGEIILIPNKKFEEGSTDESIFLSNELYHVKQGDTLYRISENLGIAVNELLLSNPELRWGLKPGQSLVVPAIKAKSVPGIPSQLDSIYNIYSQYDLSKYKCDSLASLKRRRPPVKIALLLPFFLKETLHPDTASYIDSTGAIIKPGKPAVKGRVAAEFYEGILLSIDSLRHQGINISLYTYDTEADTNRLKEIIDELKIIEPTLIIGPLASRNIALASRFSFEYKIPLVSPIAKNHPSFTSNPFVYQVIPSSDQSDYLYARHIARQLDTTGITLVYKDNIKFKEKADTIKSIILHEAGIYMETDSGFIREIIINDSLQVKLDSSLYDSVPNKVLILSNYEPDVINVLAQLHFLLRDHQFIQAFGFPAWQKFDNARIDVMHELQVNLYSPFYIDYERDIVKEFVRKCRQLLNTEPYKTSSKGSGINYTFMGFDLATYFISAVNKYGKNTCSCTQHYTPYNLLSNYHFLRNTEKGYMENSSVTVLQYSKKYNIINQGIISGH